MAIRDAVRLHYELYRPQSTAQSSGSGGKDSSDSGTARPTNASDKSPLLVVMGAFATKAHFASTARHIADELGHEVCLFDHRGVGRSSRPVLEAQTAASLAADALVVADALWGADTPIHVYG
jgi:pimeloyl-ACP methyl ester carboxylesterase